MARDEIGVRFLVTPGLEGVLKRHWEIVALESPRFLPSLLSLKGHLELVEESLAPQARGPGTLEAL